MESMANNSNAYFAAKQIVPRTANSITKAKKSFQSISSHMDVLSDCALIFARMAVSITVTKTVAIAGPIKPKM